MALSHTGEFSPSVQTFSLKTIYDYVMETPSNTNPNVLKSLLGKLEANGSSNNSIANAFLVPIMNANGTLISPSTYNELATASNEGISILFALPKGVAQATKDKSRSSFSATFDSVTYTFNSDNTITTVEHQTA